MLISASRPLNQEWVKKIKENSASMQETAISDLKAANSCIPDWLQLMGKPDAAPYACALNISTVNEFVECVHSQKDPLGGSGISWPPQLKADLKAASELRYELLLPFFDLEPSDFADKKWFADFCDTHRTLKSLAAISYVKLTSIISALENISEQGKARIEGAWASSERVLSPPGKLRLPLFLAGLPLRLVDVFASDYNITSLENINEASVERVATKELGDPSDFQKLYQVFRSNNAAANAVLSPNTDKIITEITKSTKTIDELISSHKSQTPKDCQNIIGEVLSNFTTPSPSTTPLWTISSEDSVVATLEHLKQELTDFKNIVSAKTADASSKGDCDFIVALNGGGILHGIPMCLPPKCYSSNPPKQLFKPPRYAILKKPYMEYSSESYSFSSDSEAKTFQEATRRCGASACASLKAAAWSFSTEASHSKKRANSVITKSSNKAKSTAMVEARQLIVPTMSFSLSLDTMELSDEAIRAARKVFTEHDGEKWCLDFYTHFSTDIHHIGGILTQQVMVSTTKEANTSSILRKAQESFSASAAFGGGCGGLRFSLSGSVSHSSFDDSSKETEASKSIKTCTVKTSVKCLGPAVAEPSLFVRALQALPDQACIIDRGGLNSLTHVADLLLRHPDASLHQSAHLIRRAWIKMAQPWKLLNDPVLNHLIRREELASQMHIFGCTYDEMTLMDDEDKTRRMEQATLRDQVVGVIQTVAHHPLNLGPLTAAQVTGITQRILTFLSILSAHSKRNLLLPVLATTEMRNFLGSLASYTDKAKTLASANLVRTFIPPALESVIKDDPGASPLLAQAGMSAFLFPPLLPYDVASITNIYNPPQVKQLSTNLPKFSKEIIADPALTLKEKGSRLSSLLVETFNNRWASNEDATSQEKLRKMLAHELGFIEGSGFHQLPSSNEELKHIVLRICGHFYGEKVEPLHNMRIPAASEYPQIAVPEWKVRFTDILVEHPVGAIHPRWPVAVRRLLDTLRSRGDMNALRNSFVQKTTQASFIFDFSSPLAMHGNSNQQASSNSSESVFSILSKVLREGDPLVHEQLLSLLLERRYMVPLFVGEPNSTNWTPMLHALELIRTNVSPDEMASLATNVHLPRFVLYEDKVSCSDFMQTYFNITTTCPTVPAGQSLVEVGFGFVATGLKQDSFTPVMLICVRGNRTPEIVNWLLEFGDFFACPSDLTLWPSPLPNRVLHLIHQSTSIDSMVIEAPFYIVWSGFSRDSRVSAGLAATLANLAASRTATPYTLTLADLLSQPIEGITIVDNAGLTRAITATIIQTFNSMKMAFKDVRTGHLGLQQSFKRQAMAELFSRSDSVIDHATHISKDMAKQTIRQEIGARLHGAKNALTFPLVTEFIKHVTSTRSEVRIIFIRTLELALARKLSPELALLLADLDSARQAFKQRRTSNNLLHLAHLEDVYNDSTCHIEHIWRELSHVFVSNPTNTVLLAQAGAQHLLDGFPLELMDGNAGKINEVWIDAVLFELNTKLSLILGREPRIFVLSICGPQSSGKSTLLNTLFGARFRVSAGMCTRGINMMLIEVFGRNNYDYVMVLDTEGIYSERHADTKEAVRKAHDNRLAAFSLWPADATIIMINGEITNEIQQDLLPLVSEAYLSSLGQTSLRASTTRLFFAQRVVVNAADDKGTASHFKSRLADGLENILNQITKRSTSRAVQREALTNLYLLLGLSSPNEALSTMVYGYDSSSLELEPSVRTDLKIGALMFAKASLNPPYSDSELLAKAAEIIRMGKKSEVDLHRAYDLRQTYLDGNPDSAFSTTKGDAIASGQSDVRSASGVPVLGLMRGFDSTTDHVLLPHIKNSDYPPRDTPLQSYSEKVLELWETINRQVANKNAWKAFTILEWRKQLNSVIEAVADATLDLSFSSMSYKQTHELISTEIADRRLALATSYAAKYKDLQIKLGSLTHDDIADKLQQLNPGKSVALPTVIELFAKDYQTTLANHVQKTVLLGKERLDALRKQHPQHLELISTFEASWNKFCAEQNQIFSDSLLQWIRTNVLPHLFTESATDRIVTATVELVASNGPTVTRKWLEDEKVLEMQFASVFDPIYSEKAKLQPEGNVEATVLSAFSDIHVTPHLAGSYGSDVFSCKTSEDSVFKSLIQCAKDLAWRKTPKLESLLADKSAEVIDLIKNQLRSEERFNAAAVGRCVQLAHGKLHRVHQQVTNVIYNQVYMLLVYHFKLRQKKEWEECSEASLLMKSKPILYASFKGKCAGATGMQLLKSYLISAMKDTGTSTKSRTVASVALRQDYYYRVADALVGTFTPSTHPWAYLADGGKAAQAMVDLDIIGFRDDDTKLMNAILYPDTHYTTALRSRLTNSVESFLKSSPDQWSAMLGVIKNVLLHAAEAARLALQKTTKDNRGNTVPITPTVYEKIVVFMDSLKQSTVLPTHLKALIDYPVWIADFGGRDSLDNETIWEQIVEESIKEALEPAPLAPSGASDTSAIVKEMLQILGQNSESSTKAGACCHKPCPMCKAPCHIRAGHLGEHVSHHQPSGLNGWHWEDSNKLFEQSCVAQLAKNIPFRYNGIVHQASEWKAVLGNQWVAPTSTSAPLRLREWIFYYKQDVLVSLHKGTVRGDCPGQYRHDLNGIIADLRATSNLQ